MLIRGNVKFCVGCTCVYVTLVEWELCIFYTKKPKQRIFGVKDFCFVAVRPLFLLESGERRVKFHVFSPRYIKVMVWRNKILYGRLEPWSLLTFSIRGRSRAVSVVTRLRTGRFGVWIPKRARDCSLFRNVQSNYMAHSVSYWIVTRSFQAEKTRGMKLTTYLHQAPRLTL